MTAPKKAWFGSKPETCDICKKPFKKKFYDAMVRGGRWGLLCTTCFKSYGIGLGIGRGQEYDLSTLLKIGG